MKVNKGIADFVINEKRFFKDQNYKLQWFSQESTLIKCVQN